MDTKLALKQQQVLSQAQIQSLEILSMDSIELRHFLENEYLENPMLDRDDKSSSDNTFESFFSYNDRQSYGSADNRDDKNYRRELAAPSGNLLTDYFLNQLDINLYTKSEWGLFTYLINCLDDTGYFTMPAEEVAEKTHMSISEVEQALNILKRLEPYGIFASSLQECLLNQLDALGMNTSTLTCMIKTHLQDIADGKISNISRHLHLSTAVVRKNIETISRLNPRPLSGFGSGTNQYIIPDIIFQKDGSSWAVILNDSWISDYHLNDYYIKMMKESRDKELVEYFKAKLSRSRFIFQSIEQRQKTLLTIAEIILERQKNFYEGTGVLIPMTMSEVAEKAGIHTSTVSRAIKGKYLQYPNGTICIKDLFTSSASSSDPGSGITPMMVKEAVKGLIQNEDKRKPLSDNMLAKLLREKNINVSRRVIAKYREELGIRSSFDRKVF